MTSDFEFVFKLAALSENDCHDVVRSSLKGTIRFGETGAVRSSRTYVLSNVSRTPHVYIIVSDFVKKLGQTYEKFSNDLKNLVRGFRKRSDESKKERFVV